MGTDKRVRYTKMFLKESLIKLMSEKPISRITIKEICEEAEINRATFYAHYRDQYDLLEQTQQELTDEVNHCIDTLVEDPNENRLKLVTLEIIKIIQANLSCVRVLWGKNGDMKFQESMSQIFRDQFISLLPENATSNETEKEFTYIYTINGCIGIIRKWIFEEYERISPEELTGMLLRISNANSLINKSNTPL